MHHQKSKKKKSKKLKKNNRSEAFGYQPNNPLTLYFKKRIEK
tara:strand:- start:344 stop:469 length:126 start_codon:yes stop_codon:yes gene_type:complete